MMVYLILPLHNEQDRLGKFIDCLNLQTVMPFVIFVDNCSKNTCDCCNVIKYRGPYVCLRIPNSNYWAGSLKAGQDYACRAERVFFSDIVAVMNNDTTFGPTFFERMVAHCQKGTIVASSEDPRRILWHKIWTRSFGVISVIYAWEPNALSNRAVFMMAEDFAKVRFHPRLLPHYCSDYAWTFQAIKNGMKAYVPLNCDLRVDETTTGITEPKTIRELFSKRCPHNPIYYTIFVLMCAPWLWKIPNVVRVWGYALVRIWRMK
jgi:glycosyltransferase involved in cell wall biosynthesis